MYFDLSITINRPPSEVFAFLRDKDTFPQKPDSPVLQLDKITLEPATVGTQYVEIVQMLPGVKGVIRSRITCYQPYSRLDEDFEGAGMKGHLSYLFMPKTKGTLLIQQETIQWIGIMKFYSPIIRPILERQLVSRLNEIKTILESGWEV